MKKISLFCGRLKSMSIKKMLLMIKQASREHKKSPVIILLAKIKKASLQKLLALSEVKVYVKSEPKKEQI